MKIIKYSVFFIVCFLTSNFLKGQNYIDYYNLCNEGNRQMYLKQYRKALQSFESGFAKVDYIHAIQYEKASQCAIQLNQYEKANQYAHKAYLQGSDSKFLKKKISKNFRKTKEYKVLIKNIEKFEQLHLLSINLHYKEIIDSLYYLDQRVIRKNKRIKGNYKIDKSTLPENLFHLDTLIFNHLLNKIDVHGFPSEERVGKKSYEKVYIILHHNGRLAQNKKHLPMMKEALLKGEYLPNHYAWMYDQSRLFDGEKPLFYYGVPSNGIDAQEKKKIDEIRTEYGVKRFSAFQIKHRGRTTIMKPLW